MLSDPSVERAGIRSPSSCASGFLQLLLMGEQSLNNSANVAFYTTFTSLLSLVSDRATPRVGVASHLCCSL